MPSPHLLLIQTENAYDGQIQEKKGIIQSSKRNGAGIGIQSVRHIAEKTVAVQYFLTKTASLQRKSCCVNKIYFITFILLI